jgi:hypothetical protein
MPYKPIQSEAIIEALKDMKGIRHLSEIRDWICRKYGDNAFKDHSTPVADMVPVTLGGNTASNVPDRLRVLRRVKRGYYCLIESLYD